ncbi:hypothetical protein [Pseudomonas purpurea]|uniref:hypothetical protein n=1 Tax=Pseudomonas purpurea TaxID=3136737 RepID=UPI0032659C77
MDVLPPGTILQLMYLKERISGLEPGRFFEMGAGAGHMSHLLLSLGGIESFRFVTDNDRNVA